MRLREVVVNRITVGLVTFGVNAAGGNDRNRCGIELGKGEYSEVCHIRSYVT